MTSTASTQAAKDNKTGTKPPTNGAKGTETTAASETPATPETAEETSKRAKKSVFIVEGKIRMFDNARDAEAFLNGGEDVPTTFRVIKGTLVEQKQKVSLR